MPCLALCPRPVPCRTAPSLPIPDPPTPGPWHGSENAGRSSDIYKQTFLKPMTPSDNTRFHYSHRFSRLTLYDGGLHPHHPHHLQGPSDHDTNPSLILILFVHVSKTKFLRFSLKNPEKHIRINYILINFLLLPLCTKKGYSRCYKNKIIKTKFLHTCFEAQKIFKIRNFSMNKTVRSSYMW